MLYIVLRGQLFTIIFVSVNAPSEEKNDGSKESYYVVQHVFDHFPKYHKKML
jgi:hypothetical protein